VEDQKESGVQAPVSFYDATWREKMRLHPFVARERLNLARFQCFEQTIQHLPQPEQKRQSAMVSVFLLKLTTSTRERALRSDLYLLEALTIFDTHPEHRKCNEPMAKDFMRRLLGVRQLDEVAQSDILNACAAWFALRDDELPKSTDCLQAYVEASSRLDLFPFVEQAWFWLRKLFTTVVVETTFSARNIAQTDLRTSLSEASLRSAILFKDEMQQFRKDDETADQCGRKRDFARACLLSDELHEYEQQEQKKQKRLRGVQEQGGHSFVQGRQPSKKQKNKNKKTKKQNKNQKQQPVGRIEPESAHAVLLPHIAAAVAVQESAASTKQRQKQMQEFFVRTT
jgi:hypothetical protein